MKIERGLGKGLSALIGSGNLNEKNDINANNIIYIKLEDLVPNPDQPRKTFSQEKLNELSESIKQKGVLQPLIVRAFENNKYQIIAGERRWRASKEAGLKEVPVIVKNLTDKQVLEIAIIENIQRDNLTPIEEAKSYHKLMQEFGYTQEEVSKEVGVSRAHVANLLRVLTLPDSVLQMVEENKISLGHVKLIIGQPNPFHLALNCYQNEWSVRFLEKHLRTAKIKRNPLAYNPKDFSSIDDFSSNGQYSLELNHEETDAAISVLEKSLSERLDMKIKINNKNSQGSIVIHYETMEDLDALLRALYSFSRKS
jgi:ParB family chromosome partitioning protein